MKLTITSDGVTVENAWELADQVVWSGDKGRAARSLSFRLAVSQLDPNLPAVSCPVGAIVSFWGDDGEPLFQGTVVSRSLSDSSPMAELSCLDRGMYLAGNQGTLKVRRETPEAAVARLCRQYGIPTGELAATGAAVSRKFSGADLWSIVTTLYTLAARQTGKQYLARFEWDKLTVRERTEVGESLVIRPGSNLLTSSTTESMEDLVTSVGIFSPEGQRLATVREGDAAERWGLLERHITQREGEDARAEALAILKEYGMAQDITVTALGDTGLTTGRTVVVRQSATGLAGVAWIESDTHTWSGGQHTVRLVLSLRNIMYESEAGGELT